jgi:hypothetical protein
MIPKPIIVILATLGVELSVSELARQVLYCLSPTPSHFGVGYF